MKKIINSSLWIQLLIGIVPAIISVIISFLISMKQFKNELIDMIYITDKNNIKIEFKNI